MDTKNKNLISLVFLGVVILAAGIWALFRYLPKNETAVDNKELAEAIDIANIKKLAEEDLQFFPLSGDDVLKKLEQTPQYQGLTLDLDTSINLNNPGNSFPFGSAGPIQVLEQ